MFDDVRRVEYKVTRLVKEQLETADVTDGTEYYDNDGDFSIIIYNKCNSIL